MISNKYNEPMKVLYILIILVGDLFNYQINLFKNWVENMNIKF